MSALLFAWHLVLLGAAPDNAFVAQRWFTEGKQLLAQQRTAEALHAFETSLQLFASPNTRLFEARTLRALGRPADALMEFERTEREAKERALRDPRYLPTAQAARDEGAALGPSVAHLRLDSPRPPARARVMLESSLGARVLPVEGLNQTLPVNPGPLHLRALAPGFEPFERDVLARAGQEARLDVVWKALPPPVDLNTRALEVSLGVVAAGALAGGTLWLVTDHQYRQLLDRCGAQPCPGQSAAISRGRALQTWTRVALGTGAAGLVAAGIFLWARPFPTAPDLRLAFGGNSVTLAGRF